MKFDVKIEQSELAILSGPLNFVVDFPIWIKGEAGKDFKFDDFTPEQLDDLKLKFSDLTDAEIAGLQEPAMDAIESILRVEKTVLENEDIRIQAESERDSTEKIRVKNEDVRYVSENNRITSEVKRNSSEEIRLENESERIVSEKERKGSFATLKDASTKATDSAREVGEHPTYVGEDYSVYVWNTTTKVYDKTVINVKGKSAYAIAVENGYKDTEEQFGKEQAAIAANSVRLANVEQNKQDKPIAGRTFLTPLFVSRGAVFNATTGFYELNGLTDITEAQMIDIYNRSNGLMGGDWSGAFYTSSARTNFKSTQLDSWITAKETFRNTDAIEVIKISGRYGVEISPKIINGELMFFQSKVKRITDYVDCALLTNAKNMFTRCTNLESVNLTGLSISLSIAESSLLNVINIRYLITNARNKSPITVTLHPTAKARLTEEDIALAVSKNITIA